MRDSSDMVEKGMADQRLAIFDHRRGWTMGLFSVLVTLGLTGTLLARTAINIAENGNSAVEVDFFVFWGAAKLAASGASLDAFDASKIREAAGLAGDDWMPWAYPPAFLLFLAPLGKLSFTVAWTIFSLVSAAAILVATRPLTAGRVQLLFAAALAPAFLPGFLLGQTSTLWTAGLVAALVALGAGRPIFAGVLIGLLTIKPQLGLLLPFALVAACAWRAIASAAVTTALLVVLPTLLFGHTYWSESLVMMKEHGETVREAIANLTLMISPYSFLAGLGIPEGSSLTVQWAITALCAVVVFLVWRAQSVSFDTRAAVLLTAIPLSSPYLWLYESALLAPAALFMLRASILRLTPFGIALGLAMWMGLAITIPFQLYRGDIDIHRYYIVPVACIAFAACLRHAFFQPRTGTRPATP